MGSMPATTSKLSTQGTRIVKFRGLVHSASTPPSDMQSGDVYIDSQNNAILFYVNSAWRGIKLTTTSTSTTTT